MKSFIQKLPLSSNSSFMAGAFRTPHFETAWHYHEKEFELVLIRKGEGKKFVGDHISDFGPGTLTLMAPMLPHLFRKNEGCRSASNYVVHFTADFLGTSFFDKPEMKKITQLLERASRGIDFSGKILGTVCPLLDKMMISEGIDRLLLLLEILKYLSLIKSPVLLSSPGVTGHADKNTEAINKIVEFTFSAFQRPIRIKEVAGMLNMSVSAFSKYFKKRTRKNYNVFLNEIRIGHACKLLIEGNLNVTAICYESGFQNIPNFLKQFRKQTGKTPLRYQKNYLQANVNI